MLHRLRYHLRRIRLELLEPRYCLSAIAFASHDIECCPDYDSRAVSAADLDGDGDLDALSASDYVFAWYENTDGQGGFGDRQVISTQVAWTLTVQAADLDRDGDLDVLFASLGYNAFSEAKIAWFENTDGQGAFGEDEELIVTTLDRGDDFLFAQAADIDGGYEVGPRTDVVAVPEPTSLLLLVTGLTAVAVWQRRLRW